MALKAPNATFSLISRVFETNRQQADIMSLFRKIVPFESRMQVPREVRTLLEGILIEAGEVHQQGLS